MQTRMMGPFGPFKASELFGEPQEPPREEPVTLAEKLRKARQFWNEPYVFKEGDLIRRRAGINGEGSLPQMCVVMRVIPDAKDKRHQRRDDIVIGFFESDNFCTGTADSRRFEPVPEEDVTMSSSVQDFDLDQLHVLLSDAHGTLAEDQLTPYITGRDQLVFMVQCGWMPEHAARSYVKGDASTPLSLKHNPKGFELGPEGFYLCEAEIG